MAMRPETPVAQLDSVSVEYPGVLALDGVSIEFRPGEVHGIVGENGAGKSTLMRVLGGIARPVAGRVLIDGSEVHVRTPADARRGGIALVHQEFSLVDSLSVADNIMLGQEESRFGWVRMAKSRSVARQCMAAVELALDPDALVGELSIAQKQGVEIAKGLARASRLLILDEPTAVLPEEHADALLRCLRRVAAGGLSVAIISHHLGRVLATCDRVTVLRDGRTVHRLDKAGIAATSDLALASLMVGREIGDFYPRLAPPRPVVVLHAADIAPVGRPAATFDLHAGEVLGFAGLVGAGRTELVQTLVGLRPATWAKLTLSGLPYRPRSPMHALRQGVVYLTEDRKLAGIVGGMGVGQNITLATLREFGRAWVSRRRETAAITSATESLAIRCTGHDQDISLLSGGNQQKACLARWLRAKPVVLIADEPTRGVDAGAKAEIYQIISRLAQEGMACILISSELNEILAMSHRVAVVRGGQIVAQLDARGLTDEQVMHLASGARGPESSMPVSAPIRTTPCPR